MSYESNVALESSMILSLQEQLSAKEVEIKKLNELWILRKHILGKFGSIFGSNENIQDIINNDNLEALHKLKKSYNGILEGFDEDHRY
jgi:hypothetical protein